MPFKSKAQARKLYATNPDVAEEFASKTPNIKGLPEKAGKRKPRQRKPSRVKMLKQFNKRMGGLA